MKKIIGLIVFLVIFMVIIINFSLAAPSADNKKEECLSCHTSAVLLEKLMPKEEAVKSEGGGEG